MLCALALARERTGSRRLARIAMIAMTTSNSIRVKPSRKLGLILIPPFQQGIFGPTISEDSGKYNGCAFKCATRQRALSLVPSGRHNCSPGSSAERPPAVNNPKNPFPFLFRWRGNSFKRQLIVFEIRKSLSVRAGRSGGAYPKMIWVVATTRSIAKIGYEQPAA